MRTTTGPMLRIALAIVLPIAQLGTTARGDEESLRDRIDKLVQPHIENDIIVGLTVGVVRNGEKHAFGYGRLNAEGSKTPDGDTVYEIGSITKTFTGILLADAVVQGRVKLDQPAQALAPEGVRIPSREGEREITLQDLSTHVSGLPRLPGNMKFTDPKNPYADYSVEDLHSFLNEHKLRRAPGEKYEYSNLAQGLLGHWLALEAGKTYEQLMHDRIAGPLSMTSTAITLSDDMKRRLAAPYASAGAPAANWDIPTLAGAGAIRSTVNDMLLFAEANLSPPKNDLGRAIDLAWKIHQQPIEKSDFAMGLGWHVARDGSTRWHNGGTGGYKTMLLVNRELNLAVVVLANTSAGEVDTLAEDIFRMLAGAKVEPRKFEKSVEVAADVMQKYVGEYELTQDAKFTVTVDDGKLMVGLTGQPTFQVYPRSETEWFYKVVDATLTFQIDDNGDVTGVELFQNGVRKTAKRLPTKKDIPDEVSTDVMHKYVGEYELAPGKVFTVSVKDDKLWVGLTGQPTFQVFPRSETEWFYKVVDATLTFEVDKRGKCRSVELLQNGVRQKARRVSSKPDKDDEPVEVPTDVMKRYVGRYELNPRIHLTVALKDDQLWVTLTGQPTLQIFPRSETEWFLKVVDATLTFEVDRNGRCRSVEISQDGMRQTAKRVR